MKCKIHPDYSVEGTFALTDSLNSYFGGESLGNNFIFSATDSIQGRELWITDGTINGTKILKDIDEGVVSSNPGSFKQLGNKLIFLALSNSKTSIYATDGTFEGTYQINDSSVFVESNYLISKNEILYQVYDPSYLEYSIWKSDGTDSGAVNLLTISSSAAFSYYDTIVLAYGLTFFTLVSEIEYPYNTSAIWATDGTALGTYEVYNNPVQIIDAESILSLSDACGQVFCVMRSSDDDYNLWKVGTNSATEQDFFPNEYDGTTILLIDDSLIFFKAYNGSFYGELYKLNACTYTSTQSISIQNSLTLFPNPNNGNFNIQLPVNLNEGMVTVTDMSGRILYSQNVSEATNNSLDLHLENFDAGIYLLQIISNENRWQQIFVKQ